MIETETISRGTLQNIRRLALSAVASGAGGVSIPVLKDSLPSGPEIYLGEQRGPKGVWSTIAARGSAFAITATFKPLAVIAWCDKVLTEETVAA